MISRMTRIQLIVFALITILGAAYVGGKYAEVDRLFVDRTFPVEMQLRDSGGIFVGAQVTYRGIGVGKVGNLTFNDDGVRARLDIEKSAPKIPGDVKALVADKSAVGEQYVDLKPQSQGKPFLSAGSKIPLSDTDIPVDTTDLLVNVNRLVSSVPTDDLRTVVQELGETFEGTGPDLARILDTTSDFVATAHENIDTTRALIHDSDTVLQTQLDQGDAITSFSHDLAKLSETLVSSDPDLRRLLDEGTDSAQLLDAVVKENSQNLSGLLNNLVTVAKPLADKPTTLQALYILYPYLLEGGYSTLVPDDPNTPKGVFDASKYDYNAAFGLVFTLSPGTCAKGYIPNDQWRSPADLSDAPFDTTIDCTDDELVNRTPKKSVVQESKNDSANRPAASGYPTINSTGKDSFEWLLLAPALDE